LKIFTEEELNSEVWKPIKNYENYYEISNLGRVRSIPRNENIRFSSRKHTRILKLYKNINKRGKTLSNKELSKIFGVHSTTITSVRQGRLWKTDQIVYGNIVPSLSNRKEYLIKSHRKDLIEGCND